MELSKPMLCLWPPKWKWNALQRYRLDNDLNFYTAPPCIPLVRDFPKNRLDAARKAVAAFGRFVIEFDGFDSDPLEEGIHSLYLAPVTPLHLRELRSAILSATGLGERKGDYQPGLLVGQAVKEDVSEKLKDLWREIKPRSADFLATSVHYLEPSYASVQKSTPLMLNRLKAQL